MVRTVLQELTGVPVRKTRYQELHVVTKIFIPVCISLSLLFVNDIPSALLLFFISLVLVRVSGVPLGAVKKYIIVIISMTCFVAVAFVLFTYMPGNRVFYEATLLEIQGSRGVFKWSIIVSDASLSYMVIFSLRIMVMVLSALLLLGSVTDRELVWGLRSIGAPYAMAVALALFFRGIGFFIKDFMTIREAIIARGFDLERASLLAKFRIYVYALIPLIVLMLRRSYELSLALESRGIKVTSRIKVRYHSMEFKSADFLAVFLSTLLLAVLAVKVWSGVVFDVWTLL